VDEHRILARPVLVLWEMGTAISDLIRIQMTGFGKTQTARVNKLLALCSTPLSANFDENSKAKESEQNDEFRSSAVLSWFSILSSAAAFREALAPSEEIVWGKTVSGGDPQRAQQSVTLLRSLSVLCGGSPSSFLILRGQAGSRCLRKLLITGETIAPQSTGASLD
jgi:hypothetical protein